MTRSRQFVDTLIKIIELNQGEENRDFNNVCDLNCGGISCSVCPFGSQESTEELIQELRGLSNAKA